MAGALGDGLVAPGASAGGRAGRRRRERTWLRAVLVAVDALTLALATGAATLLRTAIEAVLPLASFEIADRHTVASAMVVAVLLLLFRQQGLYDLDRVLAGSREYALVAAAVTYGMLAALAVSYFAGEGPLISRSWLLLLWATSISFACLGRFGLRRAVRRLRHRGVLRTRIVIVGASPVGVRVAERFRAAQDEGLDVVGFLDEYLPLGEPVLDDLCVIGRPGDVVRGTCPGQPDEYVLVAQALPHERQQQLMHWPASPGAPLLRVAMGSVELLTYGADLAERAGVPLVTLGRVRIVGLDAVLKRVLDVAGAIVGLLVLAPLAGIAIARARLAGPGAVVQRWRIRTPGRHDVALWLLAPAVATLLPVRGAPALVAVLAGRLSLVGPRPIPVGGSGQLEEEPRLAAVKPGLTGPWRLSGPGASLSEQAATDLAYVRAYSVWEDRRILWATLRCAWTGGPTGALGRWQGTDASTSRPTTAHPGEDLSRGRRVGQIVSST